MENGGQTAVDRALQTSKSPHKVERLMTELKTKLNNTSVADFLDGIEDEGIRRDCWAVVDIMKAATKKDPRMWGSSIVGFGQYHYVYASGREGDWPVTAFSPRKQNITLYIMSGFEHYDDLLAKLGRYTCGKSCLYIRRLSDVHVPTLRKLVRESVRHMVKVHSRTQRKRSKATSTVAG